MPNTNLSPAVKSAASALKDYDNLINNPYAGWYPNIGSMVSQSRKAADKAIKKTLKEAAAWDPKVKFAPYLIISGESYNEWVRQYWLLDDLEPMPCAEETNAVNIPGTDPQLYYAHSILPKAYPLTTAMANRRGHVAFDADIISPVLRVRSKPGKVSRSDDVWMSFTPMEIFTLRGGIRAAKGHTVIAGLGMGYQLIEVSRKKSVKSITLVEIDKPLLKWVLPKVKAKMGPLDKFEVITGDAHDVVPYLKADVALIDIEKGYGGNEFPLCWRDDKRKRVCPDIGRIWVWGSCYVR